MTKLERIELKIATERKLLDRSIAQRDAAISTLTKSADRIKKCGRALSRLEQQRAEIRREERANRKSAPARMHDGDEIPVL